jgi:hypothetical protein
MYLSFFLFFRLMDGILNMGLAVLECLTALVPLGPAGASGAPCS